MDAEVRGQGRGGGDELTVPDFWRCSSWRGGGGGLIRRLGSGFGGKRRIWLLGPAILCAVGITGGGLYTVMGRGVRGREGYNAK